MHSKQINSSEEYDMRFAHTMVRVSDLEESLDFWCDKLGLIETRRNDYERAVSLLFS